MAAGKQGIRDWKHFFMSSIHRNKSPNVDNLYVNTRAQKGGAQDNPIKLVTPTMQVTDQARASSENLDRGLRGMNRTYRTIRKGSRAKKRMTNRKSKVGRPKSTSKRKKNKTKRRV